MLRHDAEEETMAEIEREGRSWTVDLQGFLKDDTAWNEEFAVAMAPRAQIPDALTEDHWRVIRFIRDEFELTGRCPHVYATCRAKELSLKELKRLFPTGYRRGACKLAGVTCRASNLSVARPEAARKSLAESAEENIYRVDADGFLVDPAEWDPRFSVGKAVELGLTHDLSERQWRVITFLRRFFEREGRVPTVYETCELNEIDVWDLELLFPSGYHRGAVKLAGLRMR